MCRRTLLAVLGCLAIAGGLVGLAACRAAESAPEPVDWTKARLLMERLRRGETLTDQERQYLDRAREERARQAREAVGPPRPSVGLVPLDEMSADQRYKGEDGGLYGAGLNSPPAAHARAAAREAERIGPLDADGRPSAAGRIVLMSIGMSNTTQEFSKFKELADRCPDKSPAVTIVDAAQGGQDAARWSDESLPAWKNLDERLRAAGATPNQVQAIWLKQARIGPAQYGEYPRHAEELKGHMRSILQIARRRFPNLRIAYLSSRIYAGYATTPLNPEPYAYESAFAVRGLIREQIEEDARLNFDGARGEVKAPLLLWGPYLWADGATPRKSDGLAWLRDDLAGDGTHPSQSGRQKVAALLLTFFKTDPTARCWFVKSAREAP